MPSPLITQVRDAIHHARSRVYRVGKPTPLEPLTLPGNKGQIWVKREDLGPIKAYKWRGAFNAMACLSEEQRASGIVAASAGNHAQGIALSAKTLDCQAKIFMPKPTPMVKRDAVLNHGGDNVSIELVGDSFSEAQEAALQYAKESGAIFVPPYNSIDVMGGQGTVADEIIMSGEGPFDRVYIAIGGGGLAAALSTWLKSFWPDVKIIGVEGNDQASMKAAFDAGEPTRLDYVDIFCDGTAVTQVGDLTYDVCRSQIDEIITVSNQEASSAIKTYWDSLRVIPEPSGAMSLAGYLQQQREDKIKPDEKILTIISGANMDFAKLADISREAGIDAPRNRSWRFAIPETNGSLVKLLSDLPSGISISDLQYGRTDSKQQTPVLKLLVPKAAEEGFEAWIQARQNQAEDVSDHPEARYRVIPFSPELFSAPTFVEVEFPERAGALSAFMSELQDIASLCYFTYTYSGERVGRALLGLDFPDPEAREAGRKIVLGLSGKTVRAVREVSMPIM